MTTGGEGGMLTTNDEQLWRKAWAFKDHGKSYAAVYETEHPPGYRWLHESFGTNWRVTEMQSAIGRIQTQRMPKWTELRNQYSKKILSSCRAFSWLSVVEPDNDIVHAYYKCYVQVRPDKLPNNWSRDRIIAELNSLGVPCFSGSCSEVYKEKAFDDTSCRPSHSLANAKTLGETSLMFLVHPTLTGQEIDKTCDMLRQIDAKITANVD